MYHDSHLDLPPTAQIREKLEKIWVRRQLTFLKVITMKTVMKKIVAGICAFVVGSVASVAVAQQTNPIPGIGVVIKKNPGGGSIATPSTGVDGSFEVKGLPMGLYDVFIGSCAPVPFVVGQDGNVLGGLVSGDGNNMMIRQNRGGDPKSAGFKQSHNSGHASEQVASCPMDARAKEVWAQVRGANAVKSNTPAATAPEIFVHATGLPTEANKAALPKQTQGATFGEKVNQGTRAAGGATAQDAPLLGGALRGGAVASAAVPSVGNLAGGAGGGAAAASYAATGKQASTGNDERRTRAREHLKREPALTTSFWNAAVANNQAELKRQLVLLGFDQASLNQSPVTIQKDPKTGEPSSFTFATQTGPLNIALKGAGSPKNAGF